MLQLLVIADDLSGAADSAIACTRTGLHATVILGHTIQEPRTEVLAMDCDTRELAPQQAAERVAQLCERYLSTPDLLVFKKIDSTLRGNVGAELAAILAIRRNSSSSGRHIVIVLAPAFPAGGRTTVDARQFVHGVPLHESETWSSYLDKSPTHLPSSLTAAGLRVAALGLHKIRAGNDDLIQSMKMASREADVLFCDSETENDLGAIAEASMVLGRETIWAGSAGLAYHLPRAAGLVGKLPPRVILNSLETKLAGPTLILVGTMSSVTREQVKALVGLSDIELLPLAPSILLAGPGSRPWSEFSARLTENLQGGRDSIVMLEPDTQLERADGPTIAKALGMMIAPNADAIGAFIASGGETARSILDYWGIAQLCLIDELEPGLPVSVAEGWRRPLLVVTKAGAFGTSDTLVSCVEYLRSL
jgi:4-hydroxythreonine-4-phosphate dehydrogenase